MAEVEGAVDGVHGNGNAEPQSSPTDKDAKRSTKRPSKPAGTSQGNAKTEGAQAPNPEPTPATDTEAQVGALNAQLQADPRSIEIVPELWFTFVKVDELKEQDLNAQTMQPAQMERLAANVLERGALESLPYCAAPSGSPPIEIVSGHHRVRAAAAAGLKEIAVLLDLKPMSRSRIVAKQIAHNELSGVPDTDVLRELAKLLENVDDLLHSALPEEMLPTPDESFASTVLGTPKADFDWRMLSFLFLPHQVESLVEVSKLLDSGQEFIGIAAREEFADTVRAFAEFGRAKQIKSVGTTVAVLASIARALVELVEEEGEPWQTVLRRLADSPS